MNNPKGSIWRKWDLHVHTPESFHHGYGNNTDETWEKFISDLENLPPEFKVIGVNDYIFVDAYKKILKEKEKGRLPNIELFLPVIELRLDKFGGSESKLSKVNFHIIFSDEINPDIIQQHFLNALPNKYILSPQYEHLKSEWSALATKDSLADLGRKIKANVPEDRLSQYTSNLEEGFSNISFDLDKIIEVLKSHYFEGKYLTAVGKTEWADIKWNDQSIADKKNIINSADLVLISSTAIEDFNQSKKSLTYSKVNDLLLDCSDAHYFSSSSEKDRIGKCFTWIKVDPTFEGLKQMLNEPEDRVFIGDVPPILEKVNNNRTKYIKSVFINKKEDSDLDEIWFDDLKIDLNHELIAIIGNKGNGKSALTDIIGLVCNSKNYDSFSFLNGKKFRNPRDNKAKHFMGRIQWESEEFDERILDQDPEDYEYEKVKYVPQQYLEILCNEEKDDFEKELKKVIFSHVPEEERLGKTTLDDLIRFKSEAINQRIKILSDELSKINEEIIKLEEMGTDQYRQRTEEILKTKKLELQAHENIKPKVVPKPEADNHLTSDLTKLTEEIDKKTSEKAQLEEILADNDERKIDIVKNIAIIDKVLGEIENFKTQVSALETKLNCDLEVFGLAFSNIISLQIDTAPLTELKERLNSELAQINNDLNPQGICDEKTNEYKDNHYTLFEKVKADLKELQNKLDEPNKKYQEYLTQLTDWEAKKEEIEGSEDKEDTIEYYEKILKYIKEQLPEDLKIKKEERLNIVRQIYRKKNELVNIYKSLYKPVEDFVAQHELSDHRYQVNFDVALEVKEFEEKFFSFVHQGLKGTFWGREEGAKRLKLILEAIEFNTEDSVTTFLNTVIENLEQDQRSGKKEKRIIKQQLKRDNVLDFYDFLFSLDYLNPIYKLKLGDTELSLLSPGEKGAILLIFYLLIDKDDIPLIIDQPEENLDNQSVYELLVPYIKEAKKRRQIIIVTHNPNLAVVCDAEQVIYAKIDKTHNYKVEYISGAIENPKINQRIVDILEGTLPAFSNRDSKYTITKTFEQKV